MLPGSLATLAGRQSTCCAGVVYTFGPTSSLVRSINPTFQSLYQVPVESTDVTFNVKYSSASTINHYGSRERSGSSVLASTGRGKYGITRVLVSLPSSTIRTAPQKVV